MKAYVAVTDHAWYEFLARQEDLDEVNFWQPNPWGGEFQVLDRGQPLLFKLKSPHNAIAGGGFFEHYTELPISVAWDAFGEKNGALSLDVVRQRIGRLRRETPRPWEDYTIGCIVLVEPFFWPEEPWIRDQPGWSPQIVRGKTYDLREEAGREIWNEVRLRLESADSGQPRVAEPRAPQLELEGGYGEAVMRPRRIGQGTFQTVITDVYRRQCAVTRAKALPALDAAHIRPFSERPEHYVRNGLLLRSDVHRLFDVGYVTVTPDYHVEVSRQIRDDFNDGENYLRLNGSNVWVPEEEDRRPDPEVLEWHNENRFRG
jgi:putative restriction endonuclease